MGRVRRYFILGLLVLLLAVGWPSAVSAAPMTDEGALTVRAPAGLRLRAGPGLNHPVILVLRNREQVFPAGAGVPIFNQGISWLFVRVWRGGIMFEGYVARAFLSSSAPAPAPQPSVRVNTAALNLRAGPGTSFAVLYVVPRGTVLPTTGAARWVGSTLWRQVIINGRTAWAAATFLRWA